MNLRVCLNDPSSVSEGSHRVTGDEKSNADYDIRRPDSNEGAQLSTTAAELTQLLWPYLQTPTSTDPGERPATPPGLRDILSALRQRLNEDGGADSPSHGDVQRHLEDILRDDPALQSQSFQFVGGSGNVANQFTGSTTNLGPVTYGAVIDTSRQPEDPRG